MKRKREDAAHRESGKRTKTTTTTSRIDAKVHHGVKQVTRALKLAKGFERQKLGRRQKVALASEDSHQDSRINAEIEALKNLDLVAAAESQVLKTLTRVKSIKQNCRLPGPSRPSLPSSPAAVNVAARLYNTKPVKDAVDAVVTSVKNVLGVWKPQPMQSTAKQARDGDSKQLSVNFFEDQHGFGKGVGAKNLSDSKDDFDNSLRRAVNDPNTLHSDDETGSIESNLEHTASRDDSSEETSVAAVPKSRKSSSKAQPRDYGFLPSLTAGGYLSGSESATDEELYSSGVKPRKNRRGQRERQAIWEKKYGRKARHLQNEGSMLQDHKPNRDAGWDSKRGAQAELLGKKGYAPRWVKARMASRQGPTGGNSTQLGKRPGAEANDARPLHPSWAAKAMAKQRDTKAFEGQKVVFD